MVIHFKETENFKAWWIDPSLDRNSAHIELKVDPTEFIHYYLGEIQKTGEEKPSVIWTDTWAQLLIPGLTEVLEEADPDCVQGCTTIRTNYGRVPKEKYYSTLFKLYAEVSNGDRRKSISARNADIANKADAAKQDLRNRISGFVSNRLANWSQNFHAYTAEMLSSAGNWQFDSPPDPIKRNFLTHEVARVKKEMEIWQERYRAAKRALSEDLWVEFSQEMPDELPQSLTEQIGTMRANGTLLALEKSLPF